MQTAGRENDWTTVRPESALYWLSDEKSQQTTRNRMAFNVFVTRRIPQAGIDQLKSVCDRVDINPADRPISREDLLETVPGRTGVVCMLSDRIDAAVMDAAGPQCRGFANYAVGFNNIDLEAATARNICVTNTPDVLTEATADLAWSLLMSAARRIVESDQFFRTGQWDGWGPMQFLGQDVFGSTIGIVGAGRIGSAVGRRAAGFKMKVLYTARRCVKSLDAIGGRRVELDDLLQKSDYVSLHVPLTDETRHLISQRELALMKSTAVLINTARGPVVDEKALVDALAGGGIAAAGLDVYENEPQPAPGLTDLPNVVCAPHIGSATGTTRTKMSLMVANDLLSAMQGQRPEHLVNTDLD
jgi:lactate dehydrogenase-like 2-hydroxyacid dehydrogenase